MGGACSTDVKGEKSIQYFGWKTRTEEPLGRPRRRWGRYYNGSFGEKKMDVELGTSKHGNEASGFIKCGEFLG
jgi:hypothetical protein